MSDGPFIPLDALATETGLPRSWLKVEADAGRLPFLVVGRRRYFNTAAVQRALLDRSKPHAVKYNNRDNARRPR